MGSVYYKDIEDSFENVRNIEQLKNKKVFISGANGLICSAIIDFLMSLNSTQNYNITVLAGCRSKTNFDSRFKKWSDNPCLKFIQYDAVKPFPLGEQIDFLILGAGNASPAKYINEPVETILGNVAGVNNALIYAKEFPRCRVLYISSSEVYGNKKDNRPYREEEYGTVDISNVRACYPEAKRMSENLCISYSKEYEIDTVIVRPGHVYGPFTKSSDQRASSEFPREVAAGHDIVMKSAGLQLRSYCYTVDCASAILTVLINGTTGEAYNISNSLSVVSIRDMADAFAIAGNRQIVFENPNDQETASYNLMSNSSLSGEKLEKLGWRGKFDIRTGAKHTLEEMLHG